MAEEGQTPAGPYIPLEPAAQEAGGETPTAGTTVRRRAACAALIPSAFAIALACYSGLCVLLPSRPGHIRPESVPSARERRDDANALYVLAIGDWGGIPVWPYVTPAQLAVRTAMAKAMSRSAAPVKRILALGDNFYHTGVNSAHDSRFRSTFEDVYVTGHPELGESDMWRVVAGNHDYYGNVSAQIAYSALSRAWHFPSEYYTFSEPVPGGGRAQFVMADTVLLSAGTADGLQGEAEAQRGEAHWAWLNETLAASTAEYLVVAGHYPVWSVGPHGPNQRLVARLRPLLSQHAVTAYFFGHDHCAQALRDGDVDHHGVGGAHLLVFGASNLGAVPDGMLAFHYGGNMWPANAYKGAFAEATFRATELTVTHYDSDGRPLATMTRPPRKSRR